MSLNYCCVSGCSSTSKSEPYIGFHVIPKIGLGRVYIEKNGVRTVVDRHKAWKIILKIERPVTTYMKVCSKHFIQDDFFPSGKFTKQRRLRRTVVPSQNLGKVTQKKKTEVEKNNFDCSQDVVDVESKEIFTDVDMKSANSVITQYVSFAEEQREIKLETNFEESATNSESGVIVKDEGKFTKQRRLKRTVVPSQNLGKVTQKKKTEIENNNFDCSQDVVDVESKEIFTDVDMKSVNSVITQYVSFPEKQRVIKLETNFEESAANSESGVIVKDEGKFTKQRRLKRTLVPSQNLGKVTQKKKTEVENNNFDCSQDVVDVESKEIFTDVDMKSANSVITQYVSFAEEQREIKLETNFEESAANSESGVIVKDEPFILGFP